MSDWEPTDEQIEAFRTAWEATDAAGKTGERVRAGLIAAFASEPPSIDYEAVVKRAKPWLFDGTMEEHLSSMSIFKEAPGAAGAQVRKGIKRSTEEAQAWIRAFFDWSGE